MKFIIEQSSFSLRKGWILNDSGGFRVVEVCVRKYPLAYHTRDNSRGSIMILRIVIIRDGLVLISKHTVNQHWHTTQGDVWLSRFRYSRGLSTTKWTRTMSSYVLTCRPKIWSRLQQYDWFAYAHGVGESSLTVRSTALFLKKSTAEVPLSASSQPGR